MNAIIMAGGDGTRLKSVTGDLPKPMVRLAGKPVLEHILNLLKKNGIRRACMALRYRGDVIRDYFGDGSRFGLHLEYHEEQDALGTAGAVRACRDFYGDSDFLVISGDSACDFDLRALIEAHRRYESAVTIALAKRETPLRYGTVLTDRTGRIVSFIEKPAWGRVVSDLVNTGIYVISPGAMEYVPKGTAFDFAKDLFPALLNAGKPIYGIPMKGYWRDIGTPRSYHQCNLDALDGLLRLDEMPEDADAPPAPAEHAPEPDRGLEYRCHGRARLMRALSVQLMEAGADMDTSDGLTLREGGETVRIRPAADREALFISASSDEAAKRYAALAKNLDK